MSSARGRVTWAARPGPARPFAPRQVRAASSANPSGLVSPTQSPTRRFRGQVCAGRRGSRCRSRKRGGPSHCGLETKAFPRCPAAPTLGPPSRPPGRSRCGPRSHYPAPAPSAAPGAARGPATPAAILHSAPFPQCHSPPPAPWLASGAPQSAPSSPPRAPTAPPSTSIPKGSQSPATATTRFWTRCRAPGGRGQVSRLRAASAPTATVDAPGICVPRTPSLTPLPMFSLRQPRSLHPQRAARGRQQARAPTETPCDGHCSVVLSFG